MRQPNRFVLSALRWFLVLWFVLTLPIVAVLTINAQSRYIFLETLAHWRSKVVPLRYVFVGDSITAGGRNWGLRLWHNPLSARCLAESGFTVWQIEGEVHTAITTYHPRVIFVLAGVNDLLGRGNPDKAMQDYADLLEMVAQAHIQAVVTLVPYNARPNTTEAITQFNRKLQKLCEEKGIVIVDLNPVIAPAGKLLPQFTTDGVHFSPAAYSIWEEKLREVLKTDLQ